MVSLLSKTAIQSLNVDTVEKALVFGALVLRAALVGSDNAHAADLAVTINVSATRPFDSNGEILVAKENLMAETLMNQGL